jgi:hypothetical protein
MFVVQFGFVRMRAGAAPYQPARLLGDRDHFDDRCGNRIASRRGCARAACRAAPLRSRVRRRRRASGCPCFLAPYAAHDTSGTPAPTSVPTIRQNRTQPRTAR